ncbi:MAG: translocation/assembly module TamB domain-containing protein, partial [Alphaproteobacteria bacterium]
GRNIGGQLSGSLDLSESARGVNGRADFSLRGVGAADLKVVPPVDAKLAVAVEPAALDLSLTVTGADLRQADLRGRVPVRLSLSPPGGRAVGNGRRDLRLSLAGDAGTLWPYIGPPDQRLSGEVAVAAHLTGTPDAPRIDGTAGVDAGRYEHLIYGTLLTGLTMRAELADRHLILREFRAADGGSGSLSASGDATLETGGAMRFAMQAEGRGVHLLRRDELRAMGDLDIRVEGNAEGAKVGGTVTVSAAEIDLAAALPPAIPTLDVHRAGDRELDRAAAQAAAYPVALDVAVAIPGQTFVRGRGLDSEWRGRLNLKGMAAAPRLTGELEAVRGQFDAIGRSFALRSSTIQFDGGAQIDPVLGIRGEYKTRDLTVVARLVGRASNPSLELDSTPALPRDEILSRVLFGKSRGRLTPVEGAQLAAALSELSGGGPSLDVLGTLRRMAGIDVLQVDTEEGATSVRAGKYVTDRVYVGARQGAASGSGGVEVEVELTPNISVNSSGQGGRSDVELLFKWDY